MQIKKFLTNFHKAQAFNFLRYISDALIYAFLPLFFNSLDLPSIQTGTLLASVPLMAILGNVVMSLLAKSVKRNVLLIKIMMPIEIVAASLIAFFTNFYLVLIFSIIMNFCNSSFYSLLDGVCSSIATSEKRNYVSIRIFGSIAYLVSSLCGGFLIDKIDYKFTFLIAGIIWCVDYIIIYTLVLKNINEFEDINIIEGNQKESCNPFKVKLFIFYAIFYIFAISASHACDTFFSLYVKDEREISSNIYGILYSSMILTEIIVMLITIFIKFKKQYIMLLISAVFLFLRIFLLCFDLPQEALYFIPSLRGIGWGLLLAYHINTIKTFLNPRQLVKAIFILTIGLHIIVVILDQVGPYLIDITSYRTMFIILTCLSLMGLITIGGINIGLMKGKNNSNKKI